MFRTLLVIAALVLCNEASASKKYTLSISTMFKNDAEFLKEWIEYHRVVGVQHFYLFNNMSDDSSKEVLQPYVEQGIVTLTDWKDGEANVDPKARYAWVYNTQVPAFEYAAKKLALEESEWIAFLDSDEFLVPVQSNSMLDILKNHEQEVGLCISWRVYGTSNVKKLEKNQLMIEALTRCTTPDDGLCKCVKTIAKTDAFAKFSLCAPHYCEYVGNKNPIHLPKEEVVINHYMNRTQDHFYEKKVKGREKTSNMKLTEAQIQEMVTVGNAMEDDKKYIFRFVPELRKKMGFEPAQ